MIAIDNDIIRIRHVAHGHEAATAASAHLLHATHELGYGNHDGCIIAIQGFNSDGVALVIDRRLDHALEAI